ncbi:MAG: hypothetical protein Q9162_000093 [Coniocarpon cinnabarinum]
MAMETDTARVRLRRVIVIWTLGAAYFNRSSALQQLTSSSGPPPAGPPPNDDDDEAVRNSGSNLFVTGINPRITEDDLTALFEKYGTVEKCNIMRDPHSKESRGFGFVNMTSVEAADAAKEGLQGEEHEDDFRGPPRGGRFGGGSGGRFGGGGGRYDDRYYDRRGGYREDPYYSRGPPPSRSYGGGGSGRYDDRGYGRRDRYDERPPSDRYGGRDDRYARGPPPPRDDYYRDSRRGPPAYADAPPPRDYDAGRPY